MWYFALVGLWVVRGGTMDTKPTDLPAVALPAPRTRADVEADMYRVNAEIVKLRLRQGDTVNHRQRVDGLPALLVQELNWYHDEWAMLARGGMHQPIEG